MNRLRRKRTYGGQKSGIKKCPRGDLNSHRDLTPQRILSPVRLPIPPPGHFRGNPASADGHRGRFFALKKMEARGGIEPPISVLQTDALPLCYRAMTPITT